jgi:hypothetical protein
VICLASNPVRVFTYQDRAKFQSPAQMPTASLKISFAIVEDMHQNGVAFHTANGMLNKDTDSTQGFIGRLLIVA